jgi:hypothetical protein
MPFGRRKKRGDLTPPEDPPAPGWDAIDAALAGLYPGIEPRHVGYVPGVAFGSGLQGASAFPADGHWHYVTYGLSELFAEEPESEVSGWGFELTMRVARDPADGGQAPGWPFTLLEQMGRHVRGNGVVLAAGHRVDLRAPITGDDLQTRLTALAFTADPQLGRIATPNGRVDFLQAVGITDDELSEMKASSTATVLATLAERNPLLITDPAR